MKRVVSNMAGVVLEFLVKPGDQVAVDQDVVMLESMKMQIPVQSMVAGTVKSIKVNEGDFVDDGAVLMNEVRRSRRGTSSPSVCRSEGLGAGAAKRLLNSGRGGLRPARRRGEERRRSLCARAALPSSSFLS